MTVDVPVANSPRRARPVPNIYARSFGKEVVLLDFGRGDYFGLDEIGASIWQGIEREEPLSDIADRVAREYDVSPEDAHHDILALVEQMKQRGLVTVE